MQYICLLKIKVLLSSDSVRDTTSEMNVIEGAPDPTFGGHQDSQSQWQLSLQWVKKTLSGELEDMTRQRMYEYTTSRLGKWHFVYLAIFCYMLLCRNEQIGGEIVVFKKECKYLIRCHPCINEKFILIKLFWLDMCDMCDSTFLLSQVFCASYEKWYTLYLYVTLTARKCV